MNAKEFFDRTELMIAYELSVTRLSIKRKDCPLSDAETHELENSKKRWWELRQILWDECKRVQKVLEERAKNGQQ